MDRRPEASFVGWGVVNKLLKFLLVGASGVVVNTALLYALYQLASLPLLVASPLAVEASIFNNFIWNDRWTFLGSGRDKLRRFCRFNLVSLGGLAITTGVLYVLVTLLGVHYLFANLAGISLATLWNFMLSFLWTWREGG